LAKKLAQAATKSDEELRKRKERKDLDVKMRLNKRFSLLHTKSAVELTRWIIQWRVLSPSDERGNANLPRHRSLPPFSRPRDKTCRRYTEITRVCGTLKRLTETLDDAFSILRMQYGTPTEGDLRRLGLSWHLTKSISFGKNRSQLYSEDSRNSNTCPAIDKEDWWVWRHV
jgi:hypothetical protein